MKSLDNWIWMYLFGCLFTLPVTVTWDSSCVWMVIFITFFIKADLNLVLKGMGSVDYHTGRLWKGCHVKSSPVVTLHSWRQLKQWEAKGWSSCREPQMNLPWCGSFPNLGFSANDYDPSAMQHATVGLLVVENLLLSHDCGLPDGVALLSYMIFFLVLLVSNTGYFSQLESVSACINIRVLGSFAFDTDLPGLISTLFYSTSFTCSFFPVDRMLLVFACQSLCLVTLLGIMKFLGCFKTATGWKNWWMSMTLYSCWLILVKVGGCPLCYVQTPIRYTLVYAAVITRSSSFPNPCSRS